MKLDIQKGLTANELASPISTFMVPVATAFHEELTDTYLYCSVGWYDCPLGIMAQSASIILKTAVRGAEAGFQGRV